jgi:stress response protein YsnF
MSSNELMPHSDQYLIASTVYDQRGDYVGVVVNVYREADGQFSMLVQAGESAAPAEQLRIVKDAIRQVDTSGKKVYVDLEAYPPGLVQIEALPLWQEQVVVNRTRRKAGEISIRKTKDEYTVEVPVRSEKLVVENVETGEILAEIGLSKTQVTQRNFPDVASDTTYSEDQIVRGHLTRFQDALGFLEAVSQFPNNSFIKSKIKLTVSQSERLETVTQTFESAGTALRVLSSMASGVADDCQDIYLELWVRDLERAATYRNWLSRYRQGALNPKSYSSKLPARSLR